jgi:hypothetical protein
VTGRKYRYHEEKHRNFIGASKEVGLEKTKYEMVSESFQTVIVVTALVKENQKGGQGHTSESLLHHLPRETAL